MTCHKRKDLKSGLNQDIHSNRNGTVMRAFRDVDPTFGVSIHSQNATFVSFLCLDSSVYSYLSIVPFFHMHSCLL